MPTIGHNLTTLKPDDPAYDVSADELNQHAFTLDADENFVTDIEKTSINVWQAPVLDQNLTAPPPAPNEGDRYLILNAGIGGWIGKTGKIATYKSGAWAYTDPIEGMTIHVGDSQHVDYQYHSAVWILIVTVESDPVFLASEAADFIAGDKAKLDGIATGAEVNVNADWNAVSGDAQILNKPTIPDQLSDLTDDATHRLVTDTILADHAFNTTAIFDFLGTGLNMGGIITLNTGITINISAGSGYIFDQDTSTIKKKVTWSIITCDMVVDGTNYIGINQGGVATAFASKPSQEYYIYLGHVYAGGGPTYIIEIFSVAEYISDLPKRVHDLILNGFGTLIQNGNAVSEQATPNELKLSMSSGKMLARLGKYTQIDSTAFLRMYYSTDISGGWASDGSDIVNVTKWNDRTQPQISSLVTMTAGYWKKDLVIRMASSGNVYVIYANAEYATEDEAKAAPLPILPEEVSNDSAYLATIVSQKDDSTIANRIYDVRPQLARIFGYGTSGASGTVTSHSDLTQLDYASAGHTGFEPTVTKGNASAGSTKITIGGTGSGSVIGAGFSIDVDETKLSLANFLEKAYASLTGLPDLSHLGLTKLNAHGNTADAALTMANVAGAIQSGAYSLQFLSGIADGATAKAFIFNSTNLMDTAGAIVFDFQGAGASILKLQSVTANNYTLILTDKFTGLSADTWDREWFQIYNAANVKKFEIGTIGNGNTEIRFFDASNTRIGFPPSDPTYFAFINNVTEIWLGTTGDSNVYINFYVGTGFNVGVTGNFQSISFFLSAFAFNCQNGSMTFLNPVSSGAAIRLSISATTAGLWINSAKYLAFGTTLSATMAYNGTNFVINPKVAGSGFLDVLGGIRSESHTINSGFFQIFDKASNAGGIKVDVASPTFGWSDILGNVTTKNTGVNKPTWATYKGNIEQYQFTVNDYEVYAFHLPHDYVKGTNIYIHVHWSHTSAAVTGGTVTWGYEATHSKGHNQAPFGANKIGTIVGTASAVQYQHIISEGQLSITTGSVSQIVLEDIEPDSVILVQVKLNANDMTGATPDPFVHYVDLHYQSTGITTKSKIPNFYV